MNLRKAFGAVLLILGVLGLVYRGFSYTKEKHEAELGPFRLELKSKEWVEIPAWAGAIAILAGGVLLGWHPRRDRDDRRT